MAQTNWRKLSRLQAERDYFAAFVGEDTNGFPYYLGHHWVTSPRFFYAIWWTTEADCHKIGEAHWYKGNESFWAEIDIAPGCNDDFIFWLDTAPLPLYIRKEYSHRCGRPGHGRLWVSPDLGIEVDISGAFWNPAMNDHEYEDINQSGGIVFHIFDLARVAAMPGFVTDLELNDIDLDDDEDVIKPVLIIAHLIRAGEEQDNMMMTQEALDKLTNQFPVPIVREYQDKHGTIRRDRVGEAASAKLQENGLWVDAEIYPQYRDFHQMVWHLLNTGRANFDIAYTVEHDPVTGEEKMEIKEISVVPLSQKPKLPIEIPDDD